MKDTQFRSLNAPAVAALERETHLPGAARSQAPPGCIRSRFCDYISHFNIDYNTKTRYDSRILAHPRGRLRRRAEGGARSGVPRLRLVTVRLGRSGTPPARHYDLAARSSLNGSGGNAGEGSAAPDPKSPRWSAERRARPAGRAPRLDRRGQSRALSATTEILRLSALRPPLDLGRVRTGRKNPDAATRSGTKKLRCLTS